MVVRKCRACASVWHSDVKECAFCGKEGESEGAVAVMEAPPPVNGRSIPIPIPEPEPAPAPLPRVDSVRVAVVPSRLPSPHVPLGFALLGAAAAALLPTGAWSSLDRVSSVLVFLGVAVLAPFAPLAWWSGARCVASCRALNVRPPAAGSVGFGLGLGITILLALEGSTLAFLRALQDLRQ